MYDFFLCTVGRIVVIGGGEIGRPGYPIETTKLDKEIIKLSGKLHPKFLFIPTASSDSQGYVEVVKKHFGKRLGCRVDCLMLIKNVYLQKELEEKILGADIIYVGGGNTLKMMRRWRFLGVDKLLKRAYDKGIVLSGLSAGGICWFDSGHSDSQKMYGQKNWAYIKVKGLGLIKGIHCPHFDSASDGKKRKSGFMMFMKKYSHIGIGIDEKCAIEFVDGRYRVIATNSKPKAYTVFRKGKKVVLNEIKKSEDFQPLELLYKI